MKPLHAVAVHCTCPERRRYETDPFWEQAKHPWKIARDARRETDVRSEEHRLIRPVVSILANDKRHTWSLLRQMVGCIDRSPERVTRTMTTLKLVFVLITEKLMRKQASVNAVRARVRNYVSRSAM